MPSYAELIAADLGSRPPSEALTIIRGWIGREEDLYLDFKTKEDAATALPSESDKRNLSKAMSGFGNSDGGLIVWGIDARKDRDDPESPDVARSLVPIAQATAFATELNTLIASATKAVIPSVRNFSVMEEHGRGYVVTYVPVGPVPPYRAEFSGKQYYKRAGSTFYPMEPFDIRDVVFRFGYPKVDVLIDRVDGAKTPSQHQYFLRVALRNNGPVSLTAFKLMLRLPEPLFVGVTGGYSYTERIKGASYRTVVLKRTNPEFRLFPEDTQVVLFGDSSQEASLQYQMNHQIFTSPVVEGFIGWTLYGENMPSLEGAIPIRDLIDF